MLNRKGQPFVCSVPEVQNQTQKEDFNLTTAEVVSALLPDGQTIQSLIPSGDCIRMVRKDNMKIYFISTNHIVVTGHKRMVAL